jgi:DNA repair exonuclease SbcCD nuclease subunit
LRILHTADVHLGARQSGYGEAGALLRRARWRALRRVVDVARERCADLVVIAGDLFDRDRPDIDSAKRAIDALAGAPAGESPVPVAVIPGNHDPFTPGSVWTKAPWAEPPETVRVFTEAAPVVRPWDLDLVLYPCPLAARDGNDSPVSWIREEREGRAGDAEFHVGVAHGSLTVVPDMPEYGFPLDPGELAQLGLDYLALGHWHSRTEPEAAARQRWAYSGSPEPLGFGHPEGAALLVDLEPGARHAELVPTGKFTFMKLEREIMEAHQVSQIVEELRALPDPERTLVSVRLTGLAPLAAFDDAARLEERLEDRCLAYLAKDSAGLRPEPEDIELARLPRGPLRRALEIIVEKQKAAEGDEAEVAGRALALAWEMLRPEG